MGKWQARVEKYAVQTGWFEEGLPFARLGRGPEILVTIEALSFKHEPPAGFALKMFVNSFRDLAREYTIYQIGRKPRIPVDYGFPNMAADVAHVIRRLSPDPVDVMGISTGGQIAQYLAADFPALVRKLVLISTAYRLSEYGARTERKSAEFMARGNVGRALATLMDEVYPKGLKRALLKGLARLFGRLVVGNVEYPDDYVAEVRGDCEMDFQARLPEITAPTLLVSGELDAAYAADDVHTMADLIPRATLKLYPGYGHNLSGTKHEEVLAEVRAFLQHEQEKPETPR